LIIAFKPSASPAPVHHENTSTSLFVTAAVVAAGAAVVATGAVVGAAVGAAVGVAQAANSIEAMTTTASTIVILFLDIAFFSF
jgi:hypothetical protein